MSKVSISSGGSTVVITPRAPRPVVIQHPGVQGRPGLKGGAGDPGHNGWSPVLASVADGERRVHQIVGWSGGEGDAPAIGGYIGPGGIVADIAAASNVRGPPGPGSGDMQSAVYDPMAIGGDAFARRNHTGTQLLATISDAGTMAAEAAENYTKTSNLAQVATSGAYADLKGLPAFASIATSGSASDLNSGTVADARLPSRLSATSLNNTYLSVSNNLSDVTDKGTARNNLGLGTASVRAEAYFQPALGFTPVNKTGDNMPGPLGVVGSLTISGLSSGAHRHIWLKDENGVTVGLIYSNGSNNAVTLRSYAMGGSSYTECALSSAGNFSLSGGIFAGAGFYGVGNIDIRNASGWGGAFRSYRGSDWASSTQRTILQHQSNQAQLGVLGGTATGTFTFASSGNFSASGSKNFLIDHPLGLENTKLVHAAVEAPEVMLQYRGVCRLVDGRGSVNIDEAARMTPGTFEALTANAVVQSLCNISGFERVQPSAISGASFEITAEDSSYSGDVAWLVTAIRKDPDALRTYTSDGLFEVEAYHEPQIEPDAEQAPNE